jgi:hypothetical protein
MIQSRSQKPWFLTHVWSPTVVIQSRSQKRWFLTHVWSPTGVIQSRSQKPWFLTHVWSPTGVIQSRSQKRWFLTHVWSPIGVIQSRSQKPWFLTHLRSQWWVGNRAGLGNACFLSLTWLTLMEDFSASIRRINSISWSTFSLHIYRPWDRGCVLKTNQVFSGDNVDE